jgi:hypothetical protein
MAIDIEIKGKQEWSSRISYYKRKQYNVRPPSYKLVYKPQ